MKLILAYTKTNTVVSGFTPVTIAYIKFSTCTISQDRCLCIM